MSEKIKYFLIRVLIVLTVFAVVMAIYHGIRFFLLVFAGALIAIFWRGVARWVADKTKLSFKWALPSIIFLNIALIVIFFWLSAPNITEQAHRLIEGVPKAVDRVGEWMESNQLVQNLIKNVEDGGITGDQLKQAFDVVSGTMVFVVDTILILAFSLFLAFSPQIYMRGIISIVPVKYRKTARSLINRQKQVLFRWFIGKILDMFSIFIMTIIGLSLLDMPMVFTFALIAFFFSFVPNIGPVISALPPMAIALLDSPQKMLHVGLLYLGIQLLESYFITPKIQKHASYVPPVILLLVQFLLAKFLGVLGLFLSTPLLVMLMVTVNYLYIDNYLEKNNSHEVKTA